MGAVKCILRLLCGTPYLFIIYSRNNNLELIGFCDASYGIGNPEKARSTSGRMYFLFGRSSILVPVFSATIRVLCS